MIESFLSIFNGYFLMSFPLIYVIKLEFLTFLLGEKNRRSNRSFAWFGSLLENTKIFENTKIQKLYYFATINK